MQQNEVQFDLALDLFAEHQIQCEDCTRWLSLGEINVYYNQVVCARCLEMKSVILVKTQPPEVRVCGWSI